VVGLSLSRRVTSTLLGWAVIWNLITQMVSYPSPFVVAPSSITMTSQVFNTNQVDTPFTPSRYVCGFITG